MKNFTISLIICLGASLAVHAQDDTQAHLRENPEINMSAPEIPARDYPSYVNLDANHIQMNGADWQFLADRLARTDSARVDIVHIGDSHLQADMGTAVSRARLGESYGSAGRALIVPFKLAGTNEPVDYVISSSTPMVQSRLLKLPWATEMGFTGIGIKPEDNEFGITLSAKEPFDSVAVYYTGPGLTLLPDSTIMGQDGILEIALPDTTCAADLRFHAPAGTTLHGFNLVRGKSGVAYHVIGNNGATYGTYNMVPRFAGDVARFNPALIIISLGTNEAFNKTSNDEMWLQMSALVRDLRKASPGAALLLTTPSECQRKSTVRRKGRRRRTTYSVNVNVKRLRDVIMGFAEKEGIPVYDFYDVAGGTGSSFKCLADSTLNKDRIHLTRAGYTLQGNLFTDALEEALRNAASNY